MRWSNAFIPTLRDDPADAEAVSHKLLLRAGFARQLMSGVYSLLPLGQRVRLKIIDIIRQEMVAIGGQEFQLPVMHPREIWEKSGRWDAVGPEMFRLKDRRGSDIALGMTHEEIFAHLAAELRSYKQLPQIFYQFQAKFRDEPRPKSGLLRVREFTMKDSYSLDLDEAGLDAAFDRHFEAYRKIFKRLGLDAIAVEASSGMMGGNQSVEFMLASDAGEDWIASCEACGYAAKSPSTKSWGSNTAMSSGCSPVPMNSTGKPSSFAIARTIPPFAVPSTFARKTPSQLIDSMNARACARPFWPVVASRVSSTR